MPSSSAGQIYGLITAVENDNTAPSATKHNIHVRRDGSEEHVGNIVLYVYTSATSTIRHRESAASGTVRISTMGWRDTRGSD